MCEKKHTVECVANGITQNKTNKCRQRVAATQKYYNYLRWNCASARYLGETNLSTRRTWHIAHTLQSSQTKIAKMYFGVHIIGFILTLRNKKSHSNRRSKYTKWQTYEESTRRRIECPMLATFTTNKVHHILNKEYRYAERAAIKMHLHRDIVVNIIIQKSVHFVAGSDASTEHRQERKKNTTQNI